MMSKLTNSTERIVVAIDGVAASGKGTIADIIASNFDLRYVQSGLIYRAIAARMIEICDIYDEREAISIADTYGTWLVPKDLYSENITRAASIIATVPEIRKKINDILISYISNNNRIVMDGRDIGTSVCPDADLKLFVTADLDVRARRRYNQLINNGIDVNLDEVTKNLRARDERDATRATSPMTIADDALLFDTSNIHKQDLLQHLLSLLS